MKRIWAVGVSLALLLATPGLATADSFASRQQAINYVIARALSQRGVPYAYGGGNAAGPSLGSAPVDTPAAAAGPGLGADPLASTSAVIFPSPAPEPVASTVGFDSSGLVLYAFAGVGIKLPRSSGEQYKVGRKVLPAQALPGDLIFYGREGSESVALFIGNGQMLEATPPAVAVSPVRTNGMTPYLTRIIES
jgi:cell wall-associated NlpC family hydrolase